MQVHRQYYSRGVGARPRPQTAKVLRPIRAVMHPCSMDHAQCIIFLHLAYHLPPPVSSQLKPRTFDKSLESRHVMVLVERASMVVPWAMKLLCN